MRLVFLGTPEAAVPSLRAVASRHDVRLVVCQPDRGAGRGRQPHEPPVKVAARELGLPSCQPVAVRTAAFREELAATLPDALVVVAYGRILLPAILALAPHGAVNVHFSLLPRWRGAAPVQRALLAGDTVTGVSTMRLVEELDAGPVFLQESTPVAPTEHAPAVEARLADLGAALLLRTLDGIARGGLVPADQDEGGVTLAPPLVKGEGALDPFQPAADVARRVRALDPWPGTWLVREDGRDVAILDAEPGAASSEAAPGTILGLRGGRVDMACGHGTVLAISAVRPAGRAAMTAGAAWNGRHLVAGTRLRSPAAAGGPA